MAHHWPRGVPLVPESIIDDSSGGELFTVGHPCIQPEFAVVTAPAFPKFFESVQQAFSSTVHSAGLGAVCLIVFPSLSVRMRVACQVFVSFCLCKGSLLSWK